MQPRAKRTHARRLPLLKKLTGIVAVAASFLLVSTVLMPVAAQADEVPVIHLSKTVSSPDLNAGSLATYTFNVECSSLTTECDDFKVTDTIPAPLTLGTVSAPTGIHTTVTTSGNTFTVNFVQPLDDGTNGLDAGGQAGFTVTALLPTTVATTYDGTTVTNTATASASNVPTSVQSSADVKLHVPASDSSTLTKSFIVGGTSYPAGTPAPIRGAVGSAANVGLAFANTSNEPVQSITVQDPSNTSATPFFYDGITGIEAPTFPSGANRVEVDWYDGTHWNLGTPAATVTFPTVPVTTPATTIKGLRFIFTNSASGTLPIGAHGSITIDAALDSNVIAIDADQTAPASTTVSNTASDWVTSSHIVAPATTPSLVSSTPVTSTAQLVISHSLLAPVATKVYAQPSILGGTDDSVTVGGINGGTYKATTMTVTEPAAGTPDLTTQGLTFDDWVVSPQNTVPAVPGIEWPVGATKVVFTYLYSGTSPGYGTPTTLTSAAADNTLPEPAPAAGQAVAGFKAVFTGTMLPNEYASLPFTFSTQAVISDTTETNTVGYEVITDDNQTVDKTASADLTLRDARINTTVQKAITPSSVYSVGGASTVVAIDARVAPMPTLETDTGGSTVGADELDVQDVDYTDAGTPANDATFWDNFNASAIVATDVPSGATMSVKYWDGTSWLPLAGAQNIAGGTSFNYTLTPTQQAAVDGLEFDYTADSGTTFAPGYEVLPNFKAVLRTSLRSDPSTAPNDSTTDTVDVNNHVGTIVTSRSASPTTATALGNKLVHLLPVEPGGGTNMISKSWDVDPITTVSDVDARSDEQRTAVLKWGTGSQAFNSFVISDSDGDPQTTDVANTVYDAFDLVKVPAITSAMDPLLTYDEIQKVELYLRPVGAPADGSGDLGWVEPSTDPCLLTGACDGTFPGYTLTATEQAETIGVRLVYVESPTRVGPTASDPTAPLVGSGVAASTDLDREVDLTFQVRRAKRSDPSAPVLGTLAGTMYNAADPGEVVNTGVAQGYDILGALVATDTASAEIAIRDHEVDVKAAKTWADVPGSPTTELGLPADPTTPAEDYPTAEIVLSGTNQSVANVDELSLEDIDDTDNPFDYVNIIGIDSISCPDDNADVDSTVVLEPASSYPTSYTLAAAKALSASDLADATGITVNCIGGIAAGSTATVHVDTQLRATRRSNGDPVLPVGTPTESVDNLVTVTIADPEVRNGTDTTSDTAHASITINSQSYGVDSSKDITTATTTKGTIAIQRDGASADATINLSGQPQGNVPTTLMTITDDAPTFWNAFNLKSIPTPTLATPINTVEVDVLTGVTYTVDSSSSTGFDVTCGTHGSDLTTCWSNVGTNFASPTLPSGKTLADVRGIRYVFTEINKDATSSDFGDIVAWERPHNPIQPVDFVATRRTILITGGIVEDDLYTNTTIPPGETQVGTTTNTSEVLAAGYKLGGPTNSGTPLWSDTADSTAELQYEHLPADVSVTKTPTGDLSLGADIPYQITVKNTGTTGDKILAGVVVTDTLPGDSGTPALVIPSDPDTGVPESPSLAFSYSMSNGSTPVVTAVMGAIDPTTGNQPITFTMGAGQTIPLGVTLTINATLDFRTGLLAGTNVTNTATVVSSQVFDNCNYTINGAAQTTQADVSSCTASTTTIPDPSAPLTIVKGVRGVEAGPLATNGTELIDPSTSAPYDDLGILKTVTTSLNSCSTTSASLAKSGGKGFYSYPCVPITRPGGSEQWESQFTNGGNIDLDKIVAIDVLPTQNDTGVIINSSRGSKWTPALTSYPTVDGLPGTGTYVVYYTASTGVATARCNGADIQSTMGMTATSTPQVLQSYIDAGCLTNGASDDVSNRTWTVLPDSAVDAGLSDSDYAKLLKSVVAMKFVVDMGSDGLAPQHAIDIDYYSQTANNIDLPETSANLGRDSIAYNSIAGAAVGVDPDETPYPFVSEPRKVGVALATGSINLSKVVTGAAKGVVAPSTYKFTVTCKSNGVPVQIFDSNGVARSPFTITPGSTVNVAGLPLYSACTVTEPTAYGATTVTLPSTTLRAEAAHSTTNEVDNPHPAFDTTSPVVVSRPTIPLATVTNEYDQSDFTVTKTIDAGGALDNETTPHVYTSPTFTASCKFDNGGSTPLTTLATTTFTLASGASKPFTNIPAGSVCTVTETDTELAANTAYVVTSNGSTASSGSTTTSVFTVAPHGVGAGATNTVVFTNTYTVGSLEVDKVLAGDPIWGANRTFTFGVTCTYNNAESVSSTVYSGTFTLTSNTPSTLSKTINNLPTGTTCAVAETDAAGATATDVTGNNPTIGNGTTQTVTVTNTYSDATLTVSKIVHTAGATDSLGHLIYPNFSYPITVDCMFQSAAVYATGYSATSPMAFSLLEGASLPLTGLPTGASCVITETDAHGADSSTVDVQSATVGSSVSNPGLTGTLTLTKDTAGGAGTNTAVVNNSYGVTSFTVSKALAGDGQAFAATSFTINVTCSAPGELNFYNSDITLPTAGGAWNQTINSLPENSVCSAVEQNLGTTGADTQTFVDSDGSTTGTNVPATIAAPGSVAITNWYLTGSITVDKTVTGDAAVKYGTAVGQFEVTLACTRNDVHGVQQTIVIPGGSVRTISAGGSTTYSDLPSGSACSLQETDSGGATSSEILAGSTVEATDATIKWTGIPLITVDTAHPATALNVQQGYTVQNTFLPASLSVTKFVTGGAIYHNGATDTNVDYGPFPVEVACTFNGAPVYDETESLTKGQTWPIPNLVAGAVCSIDETDAMDAASTKIVTVTGADPAVTNTATSVTGLVLKPDDGSTANTANITNHYLTGTLLLSKVVAGTGATDWGQGPFTITVSCSLTDQTGTRASLDEMYSVTGATPAISIPNVAAGSDCTVTETKTVGANSTTITLGTGTAAAETTATFTSPTSTSMALVVTNEFDEATVNVTKNRGGAGAALYGAGPFEVSMTCKRPIDGTLTPFTVPGGATRTLQSPTYLATYTGLPAGATCIPSETKKGGANSTTISPASFVTDATTATDLEITNTYTVGAIAVTKTVTGPGASLYGNGPFEVSLACTRVVNGATQSILIPGGATRQLLSSASFTATYDLLPTGAICTITETKTHGATSSAFTSPTTVTIGDETATPATSPTAITLTNTFDIGFVTVNNKITGNDAKRHRKDTYDVVLSCTENIDGVDTPISIPDGATRDIWDKTSITYNDLPIGAKCGLVESVTNKAQTVTVMWHGMPVPINTVVIGDPDFTINVVNVYNIVLAYTGESVVLQLILSLLALLAGLVIVTVTVIRRRRGEGLAS